MKALMRPLSRRTVNVNTTHPSANPVFSFRTFLYPLEVKAAIAPIVSRAVQRCIQSFQFGSVEVAPGLNITSVAAISSYLRGMFNPTLAHRGGTASMLPEEHRGVVDPRLEVYGVGKLSVIDASVILVWRRRTFALRFMRLQRRQRI
jgi:choline dehydrogenase-like flavoprotein